MYRFDIQLPFLSTRRIWEGHSYRFYAPILELLSTRAVKAGHAGFPQHPVWDAEKLSVTHTPTATLHAGAMSPAL